MAAPFIHWPKDKPMPEWVRLNNALAAQEAGQRNECEKDIREYLEEMASDPAEARGRDWNL